VIKFLQGSSKCGFDGENHFVTSEKGTLFKINPGKKEMSIISEAPGLSMIANCAFAVEPFTEYFKPESVMSKLVLFTAVSKTKSFQGKHGFILTGFEKAQNGYMGVTGYTYSELRSTDFCSPFDPRASEYQYLVKVDGQTHFLESKQHMFALLYKVHEVNEMTVNDRSDSSSVTVTEKGKNFELGRCTEKFSKSLEMPKRGIRLIGKVLGQKLPLADGKTVVFTSYSQLKVFGNSKDKVGKILNYQLQMNTWAEQKSFNVFTEDRNYTVTVFDETNTAIEYYTHHQWYNGQ
jgi:hypothetical protein